RDREGCPGPHRREPDRDRRLRRVLRRVPPLACLLPDPRQEAERAPALAGLEASGLAAGAHGQRPRARATASTSASVLCRWNDSRTAPARMDALTFAVRRRSRPVSVATVTIAESPLGRPSRARSAFVRLRSR